jgi:hypothetical protein
MSQLHNDPLKGERKEDVLAQPEVQESIRYGATPDNLNYVQLFALFFAGIILVIVLVYASMTMYRYMIFKSSQEAAINAVFYELEDLKERQKQTLTTFEILDLEAGIYRVPVDSAISLVLDDYSL